MSLSPDVNDPGFRAIGFDELKDVYREQIDALLEGGVDFILIETIFDTLNAKAGVLAAIEAGEARGTEVPLMISMTLTAMSGRNLSGHSVEAFWAPRSEERRVGEEFVITCSTRRSPLYEK